MYESAPRMCVLDAGFAPLAHFGFPLFLRAHSLSRLYSHILPLSEMCSAALHTISLNHSRKRMGSIVRMHARHALVASW